MQDLILATVNDKINSYGVTSSDYAAIAPNIPMGLLDAYVTGQGITSVMIDADADNLSFDVEIEKIIEAKPLLVGIIISGSNPSASTQTMDGVIKFFDELFPILSCSMEISIPNIIISLYDRFLPFPDPISNIILLLDIFCIKLSVHFQVCILVFAKSFAIWS